MRGYAGERGREGIPLLSFVIPCYNIGAGLLGRCLDSIAGQGLASGDYEVIIVDDGSDDFPHGLLATYPCNVRYLPVTHRGPGAARNAGLDAARGEYVQFVDADDYLHDGTLARYLPLLEAGRCDILCFDFKPTGDAGRTDAPLPAATRFQTYRSGAEYMCRHNLRGIVWLFAFRRELASSPHVRFPTGVYHEDEAFCTALFLHAGTTVHASLPVYAYFRRPGSIMTGQAHGHVEKRLADFRLILGRVAAWRQGSTPLDAVQRQGLERKINLLACDYLRNLFRARVPIPRVRAEIRSMRADGLFPLPRRGYSPAYEAFRMLSQCRWGLFLLGWAERVTHKMKR